jgi:citrate synthase
MPEFVTSVSEVGDGFVNIRGISQAEIMRRLTYAEGAFLSIIGRLPTRAEVRLVDAILNSLLDHGFVASTVTAARYIASGNPQFIPAVAGGLLAAGENTLSPEHCYELLELHRRMVDEQNLAEEDAAKAIVGSYRSEGRRLPGFGHPVHRTGDFRAAILFELAAELQLAGPAQRCLLALHAEFVRQSGKTTIPINIDGALAAIAKDLGWSAHQAVAFAVLAVLPGLMAHVIEEITEGRPLRHIRDGEYRGAPLRSPQSASEA